MVKLPDFDDMLELTVKIGDAKKAIAMTSILLDDLKSEIALEVTDNKEYWVNGKPPSAALLKETYLNTGYDQDTREKLKTLKITLAENQGQLKTLELTFQVYQDIIDVWRTQSANDRKAVNAY